MVLRNISDWAGLLIFLFRGGVSQLCFPKQRVEASAEGLVARQLTSFGNPVQLPIERFGGFQPSRAFRIVQPLPRFCIALDFVMAVQLMRGSARSRAPRDAKGSTGRD